MSFRRRFQGLSLDGGFSTRRQDPGLFPDALSALEILAGTEYWIKGTGPFLIREIRFSGASHRCDTAAPAVTTGKMPVPPSAGLEASPKGAQGNSWGAADRRKA
jgi:hypothetical protein